ncbi:MAG TPA: ATP-binding protein [Tepidisphaeraceae bacterium]|jgi:hypothetical protein|nr:ATP-binding protein [Tepidisphaeraceae bacterium]
MFTKPLSEAEKRVLIVAPTARDAEITRVLLTQAGLNCLVCENLLRLCREIQAGVGAILLTEEILFAEGINDLIAVLNAQPPWSDLPIVLMMRGGVQSPAAARVLQSLNNVVLLERPAPTRSVVSAVQAAVRARTRQYQTREQIEIIRRGEQRMTRLVEANIMGVAFCNADRVLEANDAFLRIVGYSRRDVEAGDLTWQKLIPPEYLNVDHRSMIEAAGGGASAPSEKEYLRKDGTRVPILLGIAGLEEDMTQFVCLVQDLTRQKQAESERLNSLESERVARAEAERASHMKDEFLATLSHELRTPLNAILGWSQILKGKGNSPEDVAEGLIVIERNARAQTQIIEDLLDMSRIISGKVRLDVQQMDLADAVRAAIETVKPAATTKEIRLQSVLDPLAHPVSGDPNRLQQVFWNLLSNSVKFTPKGGRVQVRLERVNSHVEVSITDTGQGIAAEFIPFVFDRFRQADASTTRRFGGLGLGLSIVKQLVELHGGSVRVNSPGTGKGATFAVALPLTVIHPEPETLTERRHPQSRVLTVAPNACVQITGVKVLIVDDEHDARALVKRLLEECDALVTTASSVSEALKYIHQKPFDVLISDIGMPGEDGYALIKKIRALSPEKGGTLPALALTAYARSEDRVKSVVAGFQMHLAKPVEPGELIAMVASLAGQK